MWTLVVSLVLITLNTAFGIYWSRREYARGLKDGAAQASSAAYERGRKAGMRETARDLANSELPALRTAGESMIKAGWGE